MKLQGLRNFYEFLQVNINVYNNVIDSENNGEEDQVEIELRSMTNYELTLNLMRYKNHFMYITDNDHNCGKYCKNMKAVKSHESNCKEITSYVLNGGYFNAQKNIFDEIFKAYKK